MQVKVFESPDMATGLRMVRQELGPDALILSTRTIRNGKLGLLGKSMLEITAAIDDAHIGSRGTGSSTPAEQKPASMPAAHRSYLQHNGKNNQNSKPRELNNSDLKTLLRERLNSFKPPREESAPPKPDGGQQGMKDELDELKSMVQSLAGEISRLKPTGDDRSSESAAAAPIYPTSRHSAQDPVLKILLDRGVSAETAGTIAGFARESLSFEDLSQPGKLIAFLHETIGNLLQVAPPDFQGNTAQQRIALIGPTGVGKTTTLAKIAAHFLSRYSRSIALITIDTYRIAAVEQLKVYGEIMRLPVDVVITPAQLEAALERHRDKDLILIDTAGRSPRDNVCIEELAAFLKDEFNIEKHLVLSAVTREPELLESINRFGALGIDRTIFSKIDECGQLGVLLNIQIQNSSPLSYITNGQRVPEDLLEIDRETVSRLILPHIEGSAS